MSYPRSLNELIENFKLLPGIGEKTAERLAFNIMDFSPEKIESFSNAVLDIKDKIKKCSICNHITEEEVCAICREQKRKNGIISVVEDSKSVILFEKNAIFSGRYHVINGLISPSNGVNPSDINIDTLLKRVKEEEIKEVIIAIKPTLEGEITALYILKLLESTDVIVSKIAQGIPMGAEMDYLDAITLENAINDRKKIS